MAKKIVFEIIADSDSTTQMCIRDSSYVERGHTSIWVVCWLQLPLVQRRVRLLQDFQLFLHGLLFLILSWHHPLLRCLNVSIICHYHCSCIIISQSMLINTVQIVHHHHQLSLNLGFFVVDGIDCFFVSFAHLNESSESKIFHDLANVMFQSHPNILKSKRLHLSFWLVWTIYQYYAHCICEFWKKFAMVFFL